MTSIRSILQISPLVLTTDGMVLCDLGYEGGGMGVWAGRQEGSLRSAGSTAAAGRLGGLRRSTFAPIMAMAVLLLIAVDTAAAFVPVNSVSTTGQWVVLMQRPVERPVTDLAWWCCCCCCSAPPLPLHSGRPRWPAHPSVLQGGRSL